MSFEVLPKFDTMDFGKIEVERPVAEVTSADIDKALERLGNANPLYKAKDGPAAEGDRLIIDFKGSIDGEEFTGGSAEDAQVVLGGRNFIPGFEEGLTGAKTGEQRAVDATFPADYPEARLAGKTARFDVTVKEVASPEAPDHRRRFRQGAWLRVGREAARDGQAAAGAGPHGGVAAEAEAGAARQAQLGYDFELPPTLVDNEFQAIWRQVTSDLEQSKRSFEDEGTTEEKAKAEYRDIAARRVRLGLILSEVGSRNKIEVSDDEVNRALLERVRQFPGQERKVYDFYRNNPQALAEIRAPSIRGQGDRFHHRACQGHGEAGERRGALRRS